MSIYLHKTGKKYYHLTEIGETKTQGCSGLSEPWEWPAGVVLRDHMMLRTLQWPEEVGMALFLPSFSPTATPNSLGMGKAGPGVEIVTHPHPCWDQLQRELCLPVFGLSMGLGAERGRRIPG